MNFFLFSLIHLYILIYHLQNIKISFSNATQAKFIDVTSHCSEDTLFSSFPIFHCVSQCVSQCVLMTSYFSSLLSLLSILWFIGTSNV